MGAVGGPRLPLGGGGRHAPVPPRRVGSGLRLLSPIKPGWRGRGEACRPRAAGRPRRARGQEHLPGRRPRRGLRRGGHGVRCAAGVTPDAREVAGGGFQGWRCRHVHGFEPQAPGRAALRAVFGPRLSPGSERLLPRQAPRLQAHAPPEGDRRTEALPAEQEDRRALPELGAGPYEAHRPVREASAALPSPRGPLSSTPTATPAAN